MQVVHDDVQVAVVVQIGQRHAVGDGACVEAPVGADFDKSQVAAIAKGQVGRIQGRKFLQILQMLIGRFCFSGRSDFLQHVRVQRIMIVAVGD